MTRRMLRGIALAVAMLLLPFSVAATVSAATDRITESEAKALLKKLADADERSTVGIFPFQEDGRHYCALDWHTALLSLAETTTKADAEAFFANISVTAVLNGAPLAIERSKVKFDTGLQRYFVIFGRVLSPDDLAVGSHTLSFTVIGDPVLGDITFTTQFFIDAAGTGACL